MCSALGLTVHALDPFFNDIAGKDPPHWVLKLVSYPPSSNFLSSLFGVGAHTDTNFLTLFLQGDIGGLQVFSKGQWIDVPSEHGSSVLVCNLGEQAQLLSGGGYFLVTPHRVLLSKQQRISVPLFYNPKLSASSHPLIDISTSNLKWNRPYDYVNWAQDNNRMLETVGDNTFKSLARSHPSVFQKHHADLVLLPDGRIMYNQPCDENGNKEEKSKKL